MSQGKIQLNLIFTATPDLVSEGDRIFVSHAEWMRESHPREGANALLSYRVAKGPEHSNPLDPSSATTSNTMYVITEVYETQAGVDNHWKLGMETWKDFSAMVAWAGRCKVTMLHGTPVVHSLVESLHDSQLNSHGFIRQQQPSQLRGCLV